METFIPLRHLSFLHTFPFVLVVFLAGLLLARHVQQRKSKYQPLAEIDLTLYFPPPRRYALTGTLKPGIDKKGIHLSGDGVSPEILRAKALPTTRAIHPCEAGDLFTPTGFLVREITALGNFPDYSVLSGVPHPRPCGDNFDISRARFRPFRPFRWEYHQTMSLSKLEPDWWIELEKNYLKSLAARREIYREHQDRVLFHEPGSELACRELMEMVLQFLCKRYPKYFHLERQGKTYTFVNALLGTRTVISPLPLRDNSIREELQQNPHPLHVLAANVPEDFAIMLRNEADGRYYLRAAAVCSSVGWDIAEKRNLPLDAIHKPVPHYATRMAPSMNRYFTRMPADKPIQRCSWSLEDGEPLFVSPHVTSSSTTASEGERRRSAFSDEQAAAGAVTLDGVRLRCDWQTLRRLPLSGAVVFNFKAVFTPLSELQTEPFVPALLARVLAEGDSELVGKYKLDTHVKAAALKALNGWAAEQVRDGVVPEGWEVRTLDEHPFYPGWEERWRERQGL